MLLFSRAACALCDWLASALLSFNSVGCATDSLAVCLSIVYSAVSGLLSSASVYLELIDVLSISPYHSVEKQSSSYLQH